MKNFLDYRSILEEISENVIYSLVFGFQPVEGDYTYSPFREDNSPGCYFSYDKKGVLRFVDYGNHSVIDGVIMKNINCFDAVKVFYNIPNFYQTLVFINKHITLLKNQDVFKNVSKDFTKKNVLINNTYKDYTIDEIAYYRDFGITYSMLLQDNTQSVYSFEMKNTKNGDLTFKPENMCFSYSFEDRVKNYLPNQKRRFYTNCTKNDIGNIKNVQDGKLLITKSYKDWRVIHNEGFNSIWLQNEGMLPDSQEFFNACENSKEVLVLFDSDVPGILAGIKLKNYINSIFPEKAKNTFIPCHYKLKDPAILYKENNTNFKKFFTRLKN